MNVLSLLYIKTLCSPKRTAAFFLCGYDTDRLFRELCAGTVRQILIFACLSMAYGLTGENVDNEVHAAGFILGFLLSVILYRPQNRKRKMWEDRSFPQREEENDS